MRSSICSYVYKMGRRPLSNVVGMAECSTAANASYFSFHRSSRIPHPFVIHTRIPTYLGTYLPNLRALASQRVHPHLQPSATPCVFQPRKRGTAQNQIGPVPIRLAPSIKEVIERSSGRYLQYLAGPRNLGCGSTVLPYARGVDQDAFRPGGGWPATRR